MIVTYMAASSFRVGTARCGPGLPRGTGYGAPGQPADVDRRSALPGCQDRRWRGCGARWLLVRSRGDRVGAVVVALLAGAGLDGCRGVAVALPPCGEDVGQRVDRFRALGIRQLYETGFPDDDRCLPLVRSPRRHRFGVAGRLGGVVVRASHYGPALPALLRYGAGGCQACHRAAPGPER